MVTVLRAGGFRVAIYLNDHAPAHVHVIGDGEARIDLSEPDGATALVWAHGMTRADLRRALAVVSEHRDALLARWREIHGPAD
jgi:hypothetical protein